MNNTLEKVFKLSEVGKIIDIDISKNIKLFNNILESCNNNNNVGDSFDRFQNEKHEEVSLKFVLYFVLRHFGSSLFSY